MSSRPTATLFVAAAVTGVVAPRSSRATLCPTRFTTSSRDRMPSATATSTGRTIGAGSGAMRRAALPDWATSMKITASLPTTPSATARLWMCSAADRGCSVTAALFSASAPSPSISAALARMTVSPASIDWRHTFGSTSASVLAG